MKKFLMMSVLMVLVFLISPIAKAADRGGQGPEKQFWGWFQLHETELYDFEKNQEAVFDQLGKALAQVDGDLTFEFGPKRHDGKREFVISAAGIRTAFPKVESLYAAAPRLKHWIFIKFRPRRPANDLELDGKTIKCKEVRYLLFKDEDPKKVSILLLLPGYREEKSKDFEQMGYLFLDEAVGEYDMETKVGGVLIQGPDSKYFKDSHPLSSLPKDFDRQFKRLAN